MDISVQINALMKKGLRPAEVPLRDIVSVESPNQCPDEEGIKTRISSRPSAMIFLGPNQCPDEEGIKTVNSSPPPFSRAQ